jgi:hypothetical protein
MVSTLSLRSGTQSNGITIGGVTSGTMTSLIFCATTMPSSFLVSNDSLLIIIYSSINFKPKLLLFSVESIQKF